MKIIIVGAGEVGRYLSQVLSERGEDVTVIEDDDKIAGELEENLDVRTIVGNGASAKFLEMAGVASCDFLLAMTAHDQLNIVTCSLASKLGAKFTVARIHDQVYSEKSIVNYQEHFNLDFLINPEALTALEFAKMIRNTERVSVEDFARGEIEVQQVEINDGGKIAGNTLRDTHLPNGLRIGYVHKSGKIFVAKADTILNVGDKVTVFGSPEVLYDNRRLFTRILSENDVRVVIYGATETAISLIRLLSNPRFKVRVFENNLLLCRKIAEMFPKITVINGSATSLRLLEEEQVGFADYFISCTKDDEENIMTCFQAKKLGVKHVQLVINKPDYEVVLGSMKEMMNLDCVVSPRIATGREILKYVSKEKYIKVGSLEDGEVQLIEVRVSENSLCCDKTVRESCLPNGCIIAALMHKNNTKVPGANDVISAGDRLILIVSTTQINQVVKLLTQ